MKLSTTTTTLGEVVDLVMGQAPSSKECNFEGKGTPFVKVGEFGEVRPIIREWTTRPLKLARRTDVLLCVVGATCGKINLGEECAIGRSVAAIRPKPEKLDQSYLFYFMMTLVERLRTGSVGAAQTVISKEMIERVGIPLPSLPQQRRIVRILDEAFAAIAAAQAKAEKNLQNARDLFASHLQSVFTRRGPGWVEKRLGQVSCINYGYTESASVTKIGPHFLRITDIQDNHVDWSSVPYCRIDIKELPKYKLVDGDIVFARTGATTGKSYLVTNPPESIFASYLIRLRLSDQDLLPQFVNLFFQTPSYWEIIRTGVSGSAQGGFNATKLSEIVIKFPKSLKEQREIVAQLGSVSAETQRLENLYQQKLFALSELKQSLLHQAFSGNL